MVLFTLISRLSDGLLLVSSYSQDLEKYRKYGKLLVGELNYNSPSRCSFDADEYCFHYLIAKDMVFLTLTLKSYPKKLAFVYLEEIFETFSQFVSQQEGPDWEYKIRNIDRPYYFIQFDKNIQQIRREYADPHSRKSLGKLNNEIQDIHNIMKQNITDILDRGGKLDDVAEISRNLLDSSKTFKSDADWLVRLAKYRKYGPIAAAVGIVILFLYIRFYWM